MAAFSDSRHNPDYFLLASVFVLTVFGLVMLASASSYLGKTKFDDSYYYIKHQLYYGLPLGLAGFLAGYFINYKRLRKLALPLLIIGLLALFMVFTKFGLRAGNASRWLQFGPLSLQPSEIMKLAFVIYLGAWLSNVKAKRASKISEGLLPFLVVSGLVAFLLLLQPATSTVVILLAAGTAMYFAGGARKKYFLVMLLLAVVGFSLIAYVTPYRKSRIIGFLNQEKNVEGQNYQINQALTAIGSGGVGGVGFGQSSAKTGYLPAAIDDFIFAVIAQELGFIGAGSLVALFGLLSLRLLWLAKKMRDDFGRLILV